MSRNLFAYGTLLVPEIWELVVGKAFRNEAATLYEYEILRVDGGDFPGIVASDKKGASVPGRIFYDLDVAAVARLDAYEDTFYERIHLSVEIDETSKVFGCDSYVVPKSAAREVLTSEIWTLEWFKNNAQAAYLKRMLGFDF